MGGRKERVVDAFNRRIGDRLGAWLTMTRPGLPEIQSDHPGDLRFVRVDAASGVAIDADVDEGYIHTWPVGAGALHPWTLGIRWELAGRASIEDVLTAYYGMVQPRDALDWLGLEPDMAPGLVDVPAFAAVRPWMYEQVPERVEEAERRHRRERRGYGLTPDAVIGNPAFGPLAAEQVTAEAAKLRRLTHTLREQALDSARVDYDVAAIVLEGDRDRRWIATSGRHRVAVASALGHVNLPVSVRMFIRRDEVESWPQVRAGIYSLAGALEVFDRYFSRAHPPVARAWVDHVGRRTSAG